MRPSRSALALLVGFPILVGAATFAQEKPEAFIFYATLSGDHVAPPVETEGSGTVIAVLVGNDLTVTGVFQDLGSSLRGSGVSVRMGVAPPGDEGPLELLPAEQRIRDAPSALVLPATGRTSGTLVGVFTLTDEQVQQLRLGLFYVQLHTVRNGSGEIRGQLVNEELMALAYPWRTHWQSSTIADAPTVPIALEPVARDLEAPVGINHFGDGSGRLVIVEQTGTLRIVDHGTLLDTPFLDIGDKVGCCDEYGLLSFAAHPDYATNGTFFVSYTGHQNQNVIERYHVSADPNLAQLDSGVVLLEEHDQFGPSHNGGHIAFGPDGLLYIAIGDGDYIDDAIFRAYPLINVVSQDLTTRLGKILRIDVSGDPYSFPDDNPFASDGGVAAEVWAWGLRNPWRFSFDRASGDLYIGDVGQVTTEEIDIVPAGQGGLNFGWPYYEASRCTLESCDPTDFVAPAIEYGHDVGCSVTGGYVYWGPSLPELHGAYLFGDFCWGTISVAERDGNGWHVDTLLETDVVLASFGEDEDGELYVADYGAGFVYRLVRTP
jgi:glucose/arabinose dehydrogenase